MIIDVFGRIRGHQYPLCAYFGFCKIVGEIRKHLSCQHLFASYSQPDTLRNLFTLCELFAAEQKIGGFITAHYNPQKQKFPAFTLGTFVTFRRETVYNLHKPDIFYVFRVAFTLREMREFVNTSLLKFLLIDNEIVPN